MEKLDKIDTMSEQLKLARAVKAVVALEKRLEATMADNPDRNTEYLLKETRLIVSQLIDADHGFQAGELRESVDLLVDAHARLGRVYKVLGWESERSQSN